MKSKIKPYTIFFAIGEYTRTGIAYAESDDKAKQKLFKQYPNAICVNVLKGRMCFEAETIDGHNEEDI